MATVEEISEANRRGLLAPDQAAAWQELRRRQIAATNAANPTDYASARAKVGSQVTPGFVRSMASGTTFGFQPELTGAVDAGLTAAQNGLAKVGVGSGAGVTAGQAYESTAAAEHGAQDAFAKAHPVQNIAGQLVGGAVYGGPAAGFIKGAGTAGVRTAQGAVISAAGQVGRAALVNGALGAAYGAGNSPNNRVGGAVTGAAVGAPLGAGFELGGSIPSRLVPAVAVGALDSVLSRFNQAGVRPSLAAANPTAAGAAKMIGENFIAGSAARRNMTSALSDAAASASNTAAKIGNATSPQIAGETAQAGIEGYTASLKARTGAIYDKTIDAIENARLKQVAAANQAANVANQNATGAAALKAARGYTPGTVPVVAAIPPVAVIQPTASGALLTDFATRNTNPALQGLFSAPVLERVASAVNGGGELSFQDLRDMRTSVRMAQKDPALASTIPSGMLQRMEGALTTDINSNAERIGGKALANRLQTADRMYAQGMQNINDNLQAFMGKSNNRAGEDAYQQIVQTAGSGARADAVKLTALKSSLKPEEWNDVAATIFDRLGKPTAGAVDQAFSPNTFSTNFNKLSPAGKTALFGSGALRTQIDNLASVINDLKRVEAAANNSRSGVVAQNAAAGAGLMSAAGTALLGHPAVLGGAAAIMGAMHITGDMLTNPKTVQAISAAYRALGSGRTAVALQGLRTAAATNPVLNPVAASLEASLRGPTASPPQ